MFVCIMISACRPQKMATTISSPGDAIETTSISAKANFYSYQSDSLNFLLKGPKDSASFSGPFLVVFKMETAKIGRKDFSFYQTREFKLDSESEFINFDNVIGIKFYSSSHQEFGQLKNYYKYQVFVFENGVWELQYDNGDMREISMSKKRSSNLSRESTIVSSTSDNLSFACSFSFLKP